MNIDDILDKLDHQCLHDRPLTECDDCDGITDFKRYYELRLRHLETPEFVQWFERWMCAESEFNGLPDLRDGYLKERNYALVGWLAGKTENAHLMDKYEFVSKVLPLKKQAI